MKKPNLEHYTEKDYWSDYYSKCKQCLNDCKQSHRIKELVCNNFKAINESIKKEA